MRKLPLLVTAVLSLHGARPAYAQGTPRLTLQDALRAARRAAPDLLVARARESVARAEVDVAGLYPNPTLAAGTSTQAARLSGTLSIPLVVLGQRGAALDAARADAVTVGLDSQVSWNDVRQSTLHAYVGLWLAEGVSDARRDSAAIEARLEGSVVQRVQVGAAPELDSLRVHAERLMADAAALDASAQVVVAGVELGRWMGLSDGGALLAAGDPPVPDAAPTLASLLAQLGQSPPVRRELSDVHAAEARVARERALVRPGMSLDLGTDIGDPTLNNATNYRAQLTIELPVFNQRGGAIDREKALGDVARARVSAATIAQRAELTSAYRVFEAATARQRTLAGSVVPAAQSAARAIEEAYALGRAQLVAVLDAERTLVDARLTALEAQAARGIAWADVEHSLGAP